MSNRRQYSDKHTLPSDPTFIEFVRSDGISATWPTSTTRIVDNEGHVNFMDPVGLDHSMGIKWRIEVGRSLAVALKYDEGKTYVLKSFPENYAMFDHNKGKADAPRHDIYLFGPPGKRFRSVPEFIPHAIWLMQDETMNSANCYCKYCSKRSQKDITHEMADVMPARSTPTSSPGPSRGLRPTRDKKPYDRADRLRVYSAVQRAPKPLKDPKVAKIPMCPERNSDLRAVVCKTGMQLRRWFRQGELLWCALDPPIPGRRGEVDKIRFWPGLVEEVKLKSVPIPRPGTGGTSSGNRSSEIGFLHSTQLNGESIVEEVDDDGPLWTVRQSTIYKMNLLAVGHKYFAYDDQVLPYQAHLSSPDLIQSLREVPIERMNFDPERLSQFNPCPSIVPDPPLSPPTFDEAAAAYTLAIEIAAKLAEFWCLTDDWEFKFPVQLLQRPLSQPLGATSLTSAIMSAGAHNSGLSNDAGSISAGSGSQYYKNVTGPARDMSRSELDELVTQMMGTPPQTQTVTQSRYQGLWWGAERIWVDDFVRLKVPRRCLAPNGADNIYPPAGPGKAVREKLSSMGNGSKVIEMGAGTRGVFMRLDGLYIVDVPVSEGGTRKECRACGMLYELADLDWEDSGLTQNSDAGPSLQNPSPSTRPGERTQGIAPPSRSAVSRTYPLPPPPNGYTFRQILPDGHEAVISLSLLGGRYYPDILSHPLLSETLDRAINVDLAHGGLIQYSYLWALEGLAPGFYNSVDPVKAKGSRKIMLTHADREGRETLQAHFRALEEAQDGYLSVQAEDVDQLIADRMEVDV